MVDLSIVATADVSRGVSGLRDLASGADRTGAGLDGASDALRRVEQAADRAAAPMSRVEQAADRMGRGVDQAARTAGSGVSEFADRADNLDSKASSATSSLGALSSGFELVGAEKYAQGLQSAALATDFLSGVGEGLNLVLNTTIGAKIRDRVVTIAQTAANRASAVATRTAAAAQWALNVAMRANPIGIVITALVALAALFVLAYKRSATFRAIVNGAMAGARTAIQWVIDKVEALFSKMGGWRGIWDGAKNTAVNAFNAIKAPIQAVIDLIQRVIDRIRSIDFPSPPDWFNRIPGVNFASDDTGGLDVAAATDGAVGALDLGALEWVAAAAPGGTAGPTYVYAPNIRVDGALDSEGTARQIVRLLDRHRVRWGR